MSWKAALCQMSECADINENLRKSEAYMKEAKEKGAVLAVFPECYMQVLPRGSKSEEIIATAQSLDGPFVTEMRSLAAKYGLWTVFGMREAIPGDTEHTKNTSVVIDDKGEIRATYSKTHLFDGLGYTESKHVTQGEELFKVIDTPFGKMGLFVCYELRFPEVARLQFLQGADFFVVPTAWVRGGNKVEQLLTFVKARAIENALYLLCCDLTGEVAAGYSCVAGPDGTMVAQAGEEETLLIAEISPEFMAKVRAVLPVFDCRRTDLYSLEEK